MFYLKKNFDAIILLRKSLPFIKYFYVSCGKLWMIHFQVFLEISQNSQENICARVCNFIKKETLT